jgi:hypothetical protein
MVTLFPVCCCVLVLQAFYVMRYRQHDKYDPHMGDVHGHLLWPF